MRLVSLIALYVSLWALALLLVLPFESRGRGQGEQPVVPGQANGAPAHFDVRRAFLRAAILGTILFVLVYMNDQFGWITPGMLDVMGNSAG